MPKGKLLDRLTTGCSGLTQRERLQRCRDLAEDARIAAEGAGAHSLRDYYLTIAAQWAGIASDIERRLIG